MSFGLRPTILCCLSVAAVAGCGGAAKSSRARLPVEMATARITDAECDEIFASGSALLDRGKESDARTQLRKYEQRCPRGTHVAEAKLKICDSFLAESAADLKVEGVAVCGQVIAFYPNHPVACAAQYRIARYHFEQMRACDRDQSETLLAVEKFQQLLDTYPGCELVEEAKEYLKQARSRLACAEMTVAEFYRKTGDHRAAVRRLSYLLAQFDGYDRRCHAYWLAVDGLVRLSRYDDARKELAKMGEECAGSEELTRAQARIGVAGSTGGGT